MGALPGGPVVPRSRAAARPGPGGLDSTCRRAMGSCDWPRRRTPHWQPVGAPSSSSLMHRDLARLDAALGDVLGAGRYVALAADLGPGRTLSALARGAPGRGAGGHRHPRSGVRAGCRSRVARDLGRRRRPVRRAEGALSERARRAGPALVAQTGAALLIGGFARTAEAQPCSSSPAGRTRSSPIARPCGPRRRGSRPPATTSSGSETRGRVAARLPSIALRAAHDALAGGSARSRAGATRRLRAVAGLRPRPHAGAVRRTAAARSPQAPGTPSPRVAGADGRRRVGTARSAAGGGCAPSSSVRPAPPRNSGARFPALPCAHPAATRCWSTLPRRPDLVVATPGRRAGRRGRLRRGVAARRLGAAGARPTCVPARRRCVGG